MNQGITIELQFFIISILWGALVLLAYDQLRILRRIIRHNTLFIAIQDLVFWTLTSVFIFAMIYVKNSGTIRGFSVMGIVIGMVLYHYIFSDWIVKIISRLILLLLRPFSLAIIYIRRVLRALMNKIRILNNGIYSQLKRMIKSAKISLNKHKQKRIQKSKARLEKEKSKQRGAKRANKRAKKVLHKESEKPKQGPRARIG